MTRKIQQERGKNMSETLENISQKIRKRKDWKILKGLQKNWDKFSERMQGKIDGIISMAASVFLKETRKQCDERRSK